jgi:hypothetical protein
MNICIFQKAPNWVIVSLMILTAGTAVVVARRFSPPNRLEIISTNGNHRLLAVAVDSAGGTILVKACDWPHTFFSPFILGDAAWPEKYVSATCCWSSDGSLAVWESQEVNDKSKLYEAAYDFRKHVSIDARRYAWNRHLCNEAIAALVAERGGLEPTVIDIPSLNSGLYQK